MVFDLGAPVGNSSLTKFDALVIGSGAGGGTITHLLTKGGLKVLVDPRTYVEPSTGTNYLGDVNGLPKTVGGGTVHADLKMPRFLPTDFQEGAFAQKFTGTSFVDWPVQYAQPGPYLMFHRETVCVGVFPDRIPGHRGRAVTHGFLDFRGNPNDLTNHPMGGRPG